MHEFSDGPVGYKKITDRPIDGAASYNLVGERVLAKDKPRMQLQKNYNHTRTV